MLAAVRCRKSDNPEPWHARGYEHSAEWGALPQDAEAGPSLLQRLVCGLAATATVLSTSLAVPQASQKWHSAYAPLSIQSTLPVDTPADATSWCAATTGAC